MKKTETKHIEHEITKLLSTGGYKTTVQIHDHIGRKFISRKTLLKILTKVAERGDNEDYKGTFVATWII